MRRDPNLCESCIRLDRATVEQYTSEPKCEAFPDGIPKEIFINGADHREPWPGDHGLQFEPDEIRIEGLDVWRDWRRITGVDA